MDTPKKIFQQIPKIMSEMAAIGKDSKNQQQGWKFRSVDAVYNELHARFAQHGVFSVPEILSFERIEKPTKAGGAMQYTIALIKYTFYADDGSSFSMVVIGEGSDSGDKSANKAMAIAHKYALVQAFLIPTEDYEDDKADVDPDYTSHEVSTPRQPAGPSPIKPVTPIVETPLVTLGRLVKEKMIVNETQAFSLEAYGISDSTKLSAKQIGELINFINKGIIKVKSYDRNFDRPENDPRMVK